MSENKKDKSNIINELSKNILFNDTCEIITNNEFEIPKTKSEGLLLWIKFSHVVYDELELPRAKARGFLFHWKQPWAS